MHYYIALLHREPKSDYGVSFPDLQGQLCQIGHAR
jgi:hypothetical protein